MASFPLASGLKKLGWIEGENLTIDFAHADGKAERLAGLVDTLIRNQAELIVSVGDQATMAAARATKTLPIVFASITFPVEQGFIESFARPGRNLTGSTLFSGMDAVVKRLDFLKLVAPAARRLLWLYATELTETVSGMPFDLKGVFDSAARSLGYEPRFHAIAKPEDIETGFHEAQGWRPQCMVTGGAVAWRARNRLAELALRHQLPSSFPLREWVDAGGLLSYAPAYSEVGQLWSRSVEYVDRILRGTRPDALAVERPARYELVINAKTARALGITIPQSLLLRADEVIQ